MNRRKFITLCTSGIAALTGCTSSSSLVNRKSEGNDSNSSCEINTESVKSRLTAHDIQLGYEVSGNANGVDTEIFTLTNISNRSVNLEEYNLLLEKDEMYKITNLLLVPKARLSVVTFGEPSIPTVTDTCVHYDKVRRVPLDQPLFKDGEATVALGERDGSHLVEEHFVLENG